MTSGDLRAKEGFLGRTVDTGEVRLHVVEARPAEAPEGGPVPADVPLVVFLHGFPEFWWSWRHQLRAFADAGFWAVAPDMRGYGGSDKPRAVSAYEVERIAADVAGLLAALGREKAFIVGHDWGAVIAWTFAQIHPSMTERLAILNVPHPLQMVRGLRRPAQLRKSWYIFFFQLGRLAERVVRRDDYAYLRRTFRADGVPDDEAEIYVRAIAEPQVLASAMNYYRASVRRVFGGRLPKTSRIDAPVLVIWGDGDRYLGKEMAEPPARFVPNARVVHLPGVSHWVQNAAPAKVNELLLGFVQESFGAKEAT